MAKAGIKIGVPPFLNAKPLVFALGSETVPRGFTVSEHPPSALRRLTVRGELDISLMPVADVFGRPDLKVIRGACISSFGEVGSVAVFSAKPFAEIATVAVDSGSSSSAMMLRVALEVFGGARPVYEKREYGGGFFRDVDAGMLIGNAGLSLSQNPPEGFPFRFDLGKIWTDNTGLPFVYAVFAARPEFDARKAADALLASKEKGKRMFAEIAKAGSADLGLGEDICRDYIENRIGYDLGRGETRGLLEFGRLVLRLTKTGGEPVINFHDG